MKRAIIWIRADFICFISQKIKTLDGSKKQQSAELPQLQKYDITKKRSWDG